MKGQRDNQPDANHRLYRELNALLFIPFGGVLQVVFLQDLKHAGGKGRTIAEHFKAFHQKTDQQPAEKHRDRYRRDAQGEVGELPARRFSNDQVLRLTHHGHHAAQRGAYARVHHQAAQEGAELF